MMIEDGVGQGLFAQVNSLNRLLVEALSISEEHAESLNGNAYYANTGDTAPTLTTTVNAGIILFLQNNSDTLDLVIEKILVSTDTVGQTVELVKNMDLGTPGNNNVHAPENMLFSSGNVAPVIAHNWDEVGDGITGITGGKLIVSSQPQAGEHIHPTDGLMILRKSNNVAIRLTGVIAEVTAGIRFYMKGRD